MIRASARYFLVFCGANRFIFFNRNNFLLQVRISWSICFSQKRFFWKIIPRTSRLSNFSTLSLLRSNEYSKSCKKFCLILVEEKRIYFVLVPFSKRLLFRDQTFRLFRCYWVFWIDCWSCEILKCLYCVISSEYWNVLSESAGSISCNRFA